MMRSLRGWAVCAQSLWCSQAQRRRTRRRRTPTRPGALFDRGIRALAPAGVDELVARDMRCEDPRAELPSAAPLVGLGQRHPARVDVNLLSRLAIGYRNRRRSLTEPETRRRRTGGASRMARRRRRAIGTAAGPSTASRAGATTAQSPRALGLAQLPAVAVGPSGVGRQRRDDAGDLLVAQRLGPGREPTTLSRANVRGGRSSRPASAGPLSASSSCRLARAGGACLISTIVTSRYAIDGRSMAALSRGGRGGMVLRNSARPGGNGFEKNRLGQRVQISLDQQTSPSSSLKRRTTFGRCNPNPTGASSRTALLLFVSSILTRYCY